MTKLKQKPIKYTQMVFENPLNGYQERISKAAPVYAMLFGPLYLLAKGLWPSLFISIIILAVCSLFPASLLLVLPLMLVHYGFKITTLLGERFLRRGWKMLTPEQTSNAHLQDNQI